MSLSPNSSLVRRTIDLKYANRQRSASIKWIFINGALFILFTLDLWYKCPGHTSPLHYVEACLAACACASAARHALRLAAHRVASHGAPRAPLTREQRRLLGLTADPLDSSFCAVDEKLDAGTDFTACAESSEEPASLSPARSWRGAGAGAARGSPPTAAEPPERALRDEFIADADHLDRYLSSVSGGRDARSEGAGVWAGVPPLPPPPYQVSPLRAEPAEGAPAPGAGAAGGAGGAAPPWRRLHLDPARLAHFNLNLRRWVHLTILERLVREMEACDAALAGAGQEARVGAAGAARLAALAAGAPPELARRLRALLPFLRPFADQAYVARRVRELARGGCLAAYRWDAGGAGWDAARPCDAELLLHLVASYLDGVVPGGGDGAFSAAHLSLGPAPPARGPGALALHRVARAPPHYAVVVGAEAVEPARGRDNLLHALLVFLAAAARRDPPALLRLHLGPAGLNMLWILDR